MRIIQANKFYFLKAGAERYMLALSRWLESQGHEVIPFAMQHEDNLETPFETYFVSRVKTHETEIEGLQDRFQTFSRMLYSLEARRKLATLITDTKPDLCHIHNIYTQISPSILHTLKDQHIPVIMTVHDHHLISPQYNVWAQGCGGDYRDVGIVSGTFSRFHKHSRLGSFAQVFTYKFHRLLKLYEQYIDVFVCPSHYIANQLVKGGFPSHKIRVNHFGIDARLIEPSYTHKGYMLYVGRLSEEKGVETIIRMARLLPDILFKIVGRGPHMQTLHHLGDGLKNIEFLGFRVGDELRELYQGACAVLIPSRVHEVFPLITLEAMAAGAPLVASNVGGMSEIVEDRVNGFLVPPMDLSAWVEAVMRLAYDKDLQLSMSRSARRSVEERYKLSDHYERLMGIYQEVGVRNNELCRDELRPYLSAEAPFDGAKEDGRSSSS